MKGEVVKVSQKGQVTLPASLRRILGLEAGDHVLITAQMPNTPEASLIVRKLPEPETTEESGDKIRKAYLEAQKDFEGVAGRLGVKNEDDVQNMITEMRHRS